MATSSDTPAVEALRPRVLADVRALPSPPRPAQSRRDRALAAGAIAASVIIFVLLGGVRPTARPVALMINTAGGAALVAALALLIMVRRDMVGPSRGRLIALALMAPLDLLAWKLIASNIFGATTPWPDRPGARCFGLTLLLSALPFVVMMAIRRRSDATHPASHGLALGVSVGLGAAVLVDLWCPVGNLPHVAGGHVLPIVLCGVLGALLGRRVLAVRRA
jgi:hypothetical protein